MKITVTFTESGDAGIPDGSTLSFDDVTDCQVSTPADIEVIDCAAAGCKGCGAVHRRLTGTARLRLEASGRRQTLLWKIPEAVTA
jgi:hypothetical protein